MNVAPAGVTRQTRWLVDRSSRHRNRRGSPGWKANMRKPNILIIYMDQCRWDALSMNGNTDSITPTFNRLASTGVNFDHCFVQNPVCMPSRVSTLTGRYPSALGITHMGVPVPPETLTIAGMLKPYGYRTANLGKLHFLPHANRDHRSPHPSYGFDVLEISEEPGCYEDAYRAWVQALCPSHLDDISVGLPPAAIKWQEVFGYDDGIHHPEERSPRRALPFNAPDSLTHGSFVEDRTRHFIRESRDFPWLAIASFYSPHEPWIAPQRYLDLYDPEQLTIPTFPPEVDQARKDGRCPDEELRAARHGYYAMISEVDDRVNGILTEIENLGIANETIVAVISDHGERLGEYLAYGKGYPAPDAVSRVPLIIRWPAGQLDIGTTNSSIVEMVDLIPTLLEGAGIPIPSSVQGSSFLKKARGEPSGVETGSALLEGHGWRSLRTHDFHYICEDSGNESLWDLRREFGEYRNLADDSSASDDLAEMRYLLLQRMIRTESVLDRTWVY